MLGGLIGAWALVGLFFVINMSLKNYNYLPDRTTEMKKENENSIKTVKYYSVESRKGGVGKTTIALNLAKALIEEGYEVLLIDCDITGTLITNAACLSPFWKNDVIPLSLPGKTKNLISYFNDKYLKGDKIDSGTLLSSELEKGKIHLIGSDMYNKDGSLIIEPSLLLDDLHSHWFVEMLKDISNLFFKKTDSGKKAIILDNSPGFVGISKSIRDWFTNIGSDNVHFILVTSLDKQDVESTITSAIDIEKMMKLKWRIAYLYEHLTEKEDKYYDELQKHLNENPELKNYFYSLNEDKKHIISDNEPELINYISVIFNKVPNIYSDINNSYVINNDDSIERYQLVESLFPHDKKGIPLNRIEYDASISGQFIESNIIGSLIDERKRESLNRAFHLFSIAIDRYNASEDKVKQSFSLNSSFNSFKNALYRLGCQSLVDSLGGDLVTVDYINELNVYIKSLYTIPTIETTDNVISFVEGMYVNDRQQLLILIEENGLLNYYSALGSLFESIYENAGVYRMNSNKRTLFNLSLFFNMFIRSIKVQMNENASFHHVLAVGYNDRTVIEDVINKIQWYDLIPKSISSNSERTMNDRIIKIRFALFYKKLCYVLLRLIDCADDYMHILDACYSTIKQGGRLMSRDLRDYCRAVVSKKTVEFNDMMFRQLQNEIFEMLKVKNTLKTVVLKKASNEILI